MKAPDLLRRGWPILAAAAVAVALYGWPALRGAADNASEGQQDRAKARIHALALDDLTARLQAGETALRGTNGTAIIGVTVEGERVVWTVHNPDAAPVAGRYCYEVGSSYRLFEQSEVCTSRQIQVEGRP